MNEHYPKAALGHVKRESSRTPVELANSGFAISSSKKKQKKPFTLATSIYHGKVVDKVEPYATERADHLKKAKAKALNIS